MILIYFKIDGDDMGLDLVKFYKTKIKKEYKIAFIVTFLIAIMIHMYKFTNNLPNADAIFNSYHNQDMTRLGRWSLSTACSISSYFDLPWVIGILSCFYIALTVVVIVAIFKVKNPIVIGIIGGLLASSPATIDTLKFLYTADGYMLAMFLAALAVYLSRIEEKRVSRKIIACILICISCGIYQAYVNFALILVLCKVIEIIIENKHSKKECLIWLIEQVLIYIIALSLYYVIWKLLLKYSNNQPYDYLGIADVGSFGLKHIIYGAIRVIKTFIKYFFLWDYGKPIIVQYVVYNILFFVLVLFIIVITIVKKKTYKQRWALVLYILSLILIIPCSSFWHFTSLDLTIWVYTPRMLQCYTILYIFAVILYERYANKIFKNIFAILMVLIIFYNAIIANITYFCLEDTYKRTYADGLEMMIRINEVASDREEIDEILFLGSKKYINGSKFNDKYNVFYRYSIAMNNMYDNFLYDGSHAYIFLRETFGLKYNMSWNNEYKKQFFDNPEVQKMGVWPAKDSVAIVDNIIIVKLSDTYLIETY